MNIKYLYITKEEWVGRRKSQRRIIIDDIKYITMFKESIGTYLQPIQIKEVVK